MNQHVIYIKIFVRTVGTLQDVKLRTKKWKRSIKIIFLTLGTRKDCLRQKVNVYVLYEEKKGTL